MLPGQLDEVAAAHLHVAGGVDPVRDRVEHASSLVRAGAAGAARAPAAATGAFSAPEVEGLRRLAGACEGEARDEHPCPGRLAGRANLSLVPLREPGQDVELLGAALAAILVDGHVVNDSKLVELARMVAEWPGLVARPDPALIEDCLVLLDYLGDARKVVDVGSGAGLPGLPLKIAMPQLELTLIESDQDKAAFLVQACAKLGLDGVEVVARRAEEAGHDPRLREAFDVAVARALAPMPVLVELCLGLVRVGGKLLAQKTDKEDNEAARHAIEVMGGALAAVHPTPSAARSAGTVVVIDKVRPTPTAYPRRPGVPH